jgi:exodeoxyribonuclease-3
MPLTIATWNINSVRLRLGLVADFLRRFRPDVLFLQEIKTVDELFPWDAFRELGYRHLAVNGQKGYHGVATISRKRLFDVDNRGFCGKDDSRHQAVTIKDGGGEIRLHNFYVPAGGDEPDPAVNDKFAHKLAFLDEMHGWLTEEETSRPSVLVGDLNVAPLENDVWSHKQLLKVVSHTPAETERLVKVMSRGSWVDAARHFVPADQRLYTWWSYRNRDWAASNRGRRLDHIWVTPSLRPRLKNIEIVREARDWTRTSDHVPVIARIATA